MGEIFEVTMEEIKDNLPLDTTEEQYKTVGDIFKELHTLCHFGWEGEKEARKMAKIEDSMNAHKDALIKLIEENGQSVTFYKLLAELSKYSGENPPMKITRVEASYTNRAKQYVKILTDAGFKKDEINKIYEPLIKRYIKNPKATPFLSK